MPKLIDSDHEVQRSRQRHFVFPLILILIALFILIRYTLSYWVDLLWFESLGYGKVFWTSWQLRVFVFLAFALMTFGFLSSVFAILRRTFGSELSPEQKLTISGHEVRFSVAPVVRVAAWAVPSVLAVGTGLSTSAEWSSFALFFRATNVSTVIDPIFGRPLNFYLFTLPVWEILTSWLSTMAVIACVLCVIFVVLAGGISALKRKKFQSDISPWRPLSATLAFSLFVVAINTYVGRFTTVLDHHTIFDGVTYTGAHVTLPGLLIVFGALLLGAVLSILDSARKLGARNLVIGVLPALVSYILVSITAWYVGNFVVKPSRDVR